MVKLWLDDLRPAPDGWTWVTNVTQAIELLETGSVTAVSLDHDLGVVDEDGREVTGNDVLYWLEEQVALHGFAPPKLTVHSANPAGRSRMLRAIEAIERRSGRAKGRSG